MPHQPITAFHARKPDPSYAEARAQAEGMRFKVSEANQAGTRNAYAAIASAFHRPAVVERFLIDGEAGK
jgi:hypothetical protein